MTIFSRAHLIWAIRHHVHLWGWKGIGASILIVATVIALVAEVIPAQRELLAMKADAKFLASGRAIPVPVTRAMGPDTRQLSSFYAVFPTADRTTAAMEAIYAAAAFNHVELERGEYRLLAGPTDRLTRYEIILPAKGAYLPIRKFIAQSLKENPTLTLDSISFRRSAINEVLIDADLRFTLYMGKE